MSGFTGEFLGTMVLIILGVGCCAGVNLKGNYAKGSDWRLSAWLGAWPLLSAFTLPETSVLKVISTPPLL